MTRAACKHASSGCDYPASECSGACVTRRAVTAEYLMGIKEGREILAKHGVADISIEDRIGNLRSTIKGFAANTQVGQMLRGERDFWLHQQKMSATALPRDGAAA